MKQMNRLRDLMLFGTAIAGHEPSRDPGALMDRMIEARRIIEREGVNTLNEYAAESHADNARWWHTAAGDRIERNKGELLMLIVSEIAEGMEGERKGLMDDKLPHRPMIEVELADALIRIFDYAGAYGLDLEGAYQEKRAFNATREDHTYEARARAGGKQW